MFDIPSLKMKHNKTMPIFYEIYCIWEALMRAGITFEGPYTGRLLVTINSCPATKQPDQSWNCIETEGSIPMMQEFCITYKEQSAFPCDSSSGGEPYEGNYRTFMHLKVAMPFDDMEMVCCEKSQEIGQILNIILRPNTSSNKHIKNIHLR